MRILMIIRLSVLFFFLSSQIIFGQSRYNFFTIGIDQGLSNSNVWSIGQDKYGFIWIATVNGLNRYDGHTIKQYFNTPDDKHSIAGNTCYWIFKDSDDEMWFACGFDGLSRYNYATGEFESFPLYDSAREKNKYRAPVWRFGEDARKRIYLSCGAACYRYDKRRGTFEDLTDLFGKGWDNGIGNFFMEDKNTMWLATDEGLFKYNVDANVMRKIPFDADKMGYGSTRMYDIMFISADEILIPLERAGYTILNTKTEKFRPADDPYNPARYGRFTQMGDVIKDSRGRFWMANITDGLIEYFPWDGHSISMKKELLYPYPYPSQEGAGKAIFEDRDGNIWYGTSTQGVIRFQPDFNFMTLYRRDYSVPHSLTDDLVNRFCPAGKGGMWIGTNAGICLYDPATNTYKNYPSGDEKNAFPGSAIRSLDHSGDTLFAATFHGLAVYDPHANTLKKYEAPDSLKAGDYSLFSNNIKSIFLVQPGVLLLVNKRVGRFYPSTGKCYYKENTPGDSLYGFKDVDVAAFDKLRNKLWLEVNAGELYEYDLTTKESARHSFLTANDTIRDISFFAMNTDEEGKVWIGTSKGILCYDPVAHAGVWTFLKQGSGNVININPGDKEWIWFTTSKEIGRISRQAKTIETFSLSVLLPNAEFVISSMKMDDKGYLWVGTNQGYCILDPRHFKSNAVIHSPQLINFKVFDEVRHFDQPYGDVTRIDLRYADNFFSFDFSSFNFQNTRGARYAYKLDEFEKDWNYTTENSASYTNVPPGTYRLLIRSANSSGGIDDTGQSIIIHIAPPFWRQLWFIALCVTGVLLIFLWLYLRRKKSLQKKNIDKTIDYFANSVYGENSVNEICWDIARNCIAQLQFEDCVVYLVDTDKNVLVQKAAYGPKNPKGHEIVNPLEIAMGQGIVGTVALTGKPLVINDTTKDARYMVDDERRFSELSVPVLHDGQVIGVIDSEHTRKNFFTEEHLKALTTIASISANKIAEAKAETQAQENEIKLLEINKMLAESQLMALRAQMNPHFVFNCLNSIQECIVTRKYGEATKYLNKFSKLFRMVLNNSGKNLVSVDEENEVLALYLELEQMRFEQSFLYEIIVDEDLETDEILIPSMLLQPYVENALWHGLMHKEGERKLKIEFKRISEDVFQCLIEDNGIGRKKSFGLKEQQSKAKRHESKGLQISKDRLDLLQRQGQHATIEIVDNYGASGQATGTSVFIELSTYLKTI